MFELKRLSGEPFLRHWKRPYATACSTNRLRLRSICHDVLRIAPENQQVLLDAKARHEKSRLREKFPAMASRTRRSAG
jgi:hypothetical protein